jgi:hypothetical protein
MRWDTGGGCLGIAVLTVLGLFGFSYLLACVSGTCP